MDRARSPTSRRCPREIPRDYRHWAYGRPACAACRSGSSTPSVVRGGQQPECVAAADEHRLRIRHRRGRVTGLVKAGDLDTRRASACLAD